MSITGNLNVFPFSLTGLQNINGTINGETPCTAITVVGSQATYLQASPVDVNGNIKVRKNEADKAAKVDGIIAMIIAAHCSLDNPFVSNSFGFRSF